MGDNTSEQEVLRLKEKCNKLIIAYQKEKALYQKSQDHIKRLEKENAKLKSQQRRQSKREPMFGEKRIKLLLMLCHPDRHGNSDSATECTKWLLNLLNEARNTK